MWISRKKYDGLIKMISEIEDKVNVYVPNPDTNAHPISQYQAYINVPVNRVVKHIMSYLGVCYKTEHSKLVKLDVEQRKKFDKK